MLKKTKYLLDFEVICNIKSNLFNSSLLKLENNGKKNI